jgi:hypothetical protein
LSAIIRRSTAARLVVLVVVAALMLAWFHLTSDSSPAVRSRAVADPPAAQAAEAAQAELAAPTPVPAATPLPAPAPVTTQAKRHGRKAGAARHRAHRRAGASRTGSRLRGFSWRYRGGRDIGWPQCPGDVGVRGRNGLGQPLPDPGVKFVIVGLTNGRAFTPNPCLDLHLRWVRTHRVHAAAYSFATYPTHHQLQRYRHRGPYDGRHLLGGLANVGHATARYSVRVMRDHGFATPHVWLDVEHSSSRPWSHRSARNRAVVRGWIRGYREAGYTVGFYSTQSLFRDILGRMRLRLPEWRTGGPVSPRAALRKCGGDSIQGGRAVIAQWWTNHRDFDRLCPGSNRGATLSRYFHQW